MKKPSALSADKAIAKGPSAATKFLSRYPNILAHLTQTTYEGGEVRRPGSIGWRTQGTSHFLTAREPEVAVLVTAIAETVDEVWTLLEQLLGSADCPWESDPYAKPMRRRKR